MRDGYEEFCNANYGPDDAPTREEQEAEAWEYWHQRANKAEAEVARLRAALQSIQLKAEYAKSVAIEARDGLNLVVSYTIDAEVLALRALAPSSDDRTKTQTVA